MTFKPPDTDWALLETNFSLSWGYNQAQSPGWEREERWGGGEETNSGTSLQENKGGKWETTEVLGTPRRMGRESAPWGNLESSGIKWPRIMPEWEGCWSSSSLRRSESTKKGLWHRSLKMQRFACGAKCLKAQRSCGRNHLIYLRIWWHWESKEGRESGRAMRMPWFSFAILLLDILNFLPRSGDQGGWVLPEHFKFRSWVLHNPDCFLNVTVYMCGGRVRRHPKFLVAAERF